MEHRPAGGGAPGRYAFTIDADRQTYQCRISLGILDTTSQHHDPGAKRNLLDKPTAPGCVIDAAADECGVSTIAACRVGSSGGRSGQKAGRAEACGIPAAAYARAGPANPRTRSAGARSFK